MIAIHFIVNPIAGSGKNHFSESLLNTYFEPKFYSITIKSSQFKGHAIALTQASIQERAAIIVACGGDGTVNEVASTLVGTDIRLGIVPVGSGNGLASNLNIPKNVDKALQVIKNQKPIQIDVGSVNQHQFFSNAGFGFTANVIGNYDAFQTRTIWSYVRASLKSFRHFPERDPIWISIDNKTVLVNPFLIFISNSNVMGYKMSLTPKASLHDGLLDLLVIPKISRVKMLWFGCCMLIKRMDLLKEANYYQTRQVTLVRRQGDFFEAQIDGEYLKLNKETLTISIRPKSLFVLV